MAESIKFHDRFPCYFGVYNHRLVIQDSRLITKNFIVLKTDKNTIVKFTKLHKYISIGKGKTSVRVDANTGNRSYYICRMLNFLFVENAFKYKLSSISDITPKHIEEFMYDYAMNHEETLKYPTEQTVNYCVNTIIDFMDNYLRINDYDRWKKQEFFRVVSACNRQKGIVEKKVPSFKVMHSGKTKTIFRDMPNSVFNLIMSYAATHYMEIFFLMATSAFTGMRPSEACNIRQDISPLGKSIYIYRQGSRVTKIKLDLTEEKQLRSDLVFVGGIKSERWQEVYPRFISAFLTAYELHLEYLSAREFESEFCPMNINRNGLAMTYDNYFQTFRKMIDEMKPMLINHSDPEISTFGHMLLSTNIAPHIFRHWFSVRLTLFGEDVAGLQYWRGDRSPLSAITYLKNKGELSKQLAHTNDMMFAFMQKAAEDLLRDEK